MLLSCHRHVVKLNALNIMYFHCKSLYDERKMVLCMGYLQESYVELEKAIRSLANFYSKAGPSAPLPEEVKSEILDDLNTAEQFL